MVRLILFILFIALCILVLSNIDRQIVASFIDKYEDFGWIIYIGCWIFLPIFFFPAGVLTIAGGLFFGFWDGLFYTMIGVCINSILSYFIARYFGDIIDANRYKKFKDKFCKDEFSFILLLRLIPIFPYNIVNYMAGVFKFNFYKFIFAGVLGKFISSVLFINLGNNISKIDSYEFWVALMLVAAMALMAFWLKNILNRRVG